MCPGKSNIRYYDVDMNMHVIIGGDLGAEAICASSCSIATTQPAKAT